MSRSTASFATTLLSVCSLFAATGISTPLADVAGQCNPDKVSFRTAEDQVGTTSEAFVSMPFMNRAITTSARNCIIAEWSGEVTMSTNFNAMVIRAVANGAPGSPDQVRLGFAASAGFPETRSMRFVFPNMPAGSYNVTIQYRTIFGGTVSAEGRSLIVHYK